MNALLRRASLRHLGKHPWLTALSLLGIALGVAVVVSIDLASGSALSAFERSTDLVAGRATHQLVGGTSGLPEGVYTALRLRADAPLAAPVVEGTVQADLGDRRALTVLGVDPFAEAPFRDFASGGAVGNVTGLLTRPGAALLGERAARALGLGTGDTLPVTVAGTRRDLHVVALLAPRDERAARALESLVLMDVSSAQELLGQVGRLSRIDLRLTDGEAEAQRLTATLPPGVELTRPSARAGTVEQMTRAFRTNLTALSLLALVVGMFLIYNTMTFSVVQRRGQLGRLRAMGLTRGELFAMVLGEASVLALVGTTAGMLMGVLMARGLLGLVTQTINDLYFVVDARRLTLTPFTLGKGLALGLGATLAAALVPAWEAARSTPVTTMRRSTLEDTSRRRAPGLALLGLGVLAVGVGLLAWPTPALTPAYAGLFAVLLGASLEVPWVTEKLTTGAARPLGALFGPLGRMAARGVTASLSRTAVALAALMVAVATTVGVGLMVSSFRGTVESWLEASLQADVFISPPSLVARRGDATLLPGLAERVRATPGVQTSSSIRVTQVRAQGVPTDLMAIDFAAGHRPYRLKEGDAERVWRELDASADALLVSEPFGFHRGVHLGDTVTLATDRGPHAFHVVGVYFDYGSDVGTLLMPRATYTRWFDDRGVSGVALYAQPGQDVDALVARVRERAAGAQALQVRANRVLRQTSMEVFDRTFTITQVLRLLAIAVAFVGVLSALMALQLERAREYAVLRAMGLTPGQLWGMVSLQTGLLGLLAGLFSVPLGGALAYVLVHVINQRSFGWTLRLTVSPGVLWQAVVLALVAAALAGLYPAWKMARARPALALREE
ncbi:ABC transporter permease [Corallococcus sp. H22C18031201]|uniref:FtsX-like permease family protein n=1 Tax=Citreicoccus inhibens TaxID=2849499 RepID=UPI000E7175CB|nr:ABC transporter permease [Citreicoccus inhibens]MBU8899695.1 ABC transporter permease [Citreicoccus inhibens]RJS18382.1 ABC transporter permease [Corallococcus sp. H22C18031201]